MILEGTLSPGDHVKLTTSLRLPAEGVEISDGESCELCFDKTGKTEGNTVAC